MLIFRVLFLLLIAGCVTDYAIVAPEKIVYIETEVEVEVEVEVDKEVPLGEVWVESFDQPLSVNGVDIIWVIDRSCSMRDDEPRIVMGVEAMMKALPATGWRLNIISSDPNKALDYREFPLVPGDTLADAYDLFDAMAAIPANQEKGFSAVHDYVMHNTDARWWMRDDAALLVVFVSDEDDQSTLDFPVVSGFTDWYTSLKPEGSAFLSSIVHLPVADSDCNVSSTWAGDRYIDATNYYSGTVVDICTEDWSAGVADAATKIEPYEEWELVYSPLASSIRVFIDGALNTDWHYDEPRNTVMFDVTPPPASFVEIGYIIKGS